MPEGRTFSMDDGSVRAWLDDEMNFHLKAVDGYGDPVELSESEIEELIVALTRLLRLMQDWNRGRPQ